MSSATQISSGGFSILCSPLYVLLMNSVSASLTTAAVIGSLVLFAVIVATLACICPRSSQPRPARKTRDNANDIEPNNVRQHVPYPEESPTRCGFKNIFGRRSLIGSNDILDSLRVSPSNPAVFGEGKSVTVSVKVTPPTPLRNGNSSLSGNSGYTQTAR